MTIPMMFGDTSLKPAVKTRKPRRRNPAPPEPEKERMTEQNEESQSKVLDEVPQVADGPNTLIQVGEIEGATATASDGNGIKAAEALLPALRAGKVTLDLDSNSTTSGYVNQSYVMALTKRLQAENLVHNITIKTGNSRTAKILNFMKPLLGIELNLELTPEADPATEEPGG